MTIADLSAAAGLHPNTTREHLARLIEAGFVTCCPEERHTRGRPRIVYRAAENVSSSTAPAESVARTELLRALLSDFDPSSAEDSRRAERLGRAVGSQVTLDEPAAPDGAAASGPETSHESADGSANAQLETLMTHLTEAGFEPTLDEERLEIELGRCEFKDLSADFPGIVCRVHLGIAKGILGETDGPVDCAEIVKRPDMPGCVLRLARTPGTDSAD